MDSPAVLFQDLLQVNRGNGLWRSVTKPPFAHLRTYTK